ncbi:MAG: signal peptidase I [Candidatus Pacebacteria bacterium]|nr:signal peptidase I [Candidatus Paceibacterota bacterium]
MNEQINPSVDGKKGNYVDDIKELFRFLIIAAIIVIPIRYFIMQPFVVSGTSMDPTFHDKEYLIVDKLTYNLNKIHRGDVVVFHFPNENQKYLVKRLIGLPGDTITLTTDGKITIKNTEHPEGFTIYEAYLQNHDGDSLTITIPDGKAFVLGDNRPVSYDSRAWGLLDEKKLVGRVYLRLWPLNRISYLPGETDLLNK